VTRPQVSVSSIVAILASVALFVPACSSTNEETPSGPSCTNGVKDENEEGTDCGLACPAKCTGAGCAADAECSSGKCNPDGKCAAPAGKPCGVGAPVAECADGEKCELDKDCKSGFCDGTTCKTPSSESHSDGKKNSGETGIDCGGSVKATAPCPDGQGCVDSTDCVGTCLETKLCGPIGPKDGKKNNDETDVDCGGPNAPKCDNGKGCAVNGDCVDDYCPDATKKCTAPTYSDGVKNGNETDVDCGGTGTGMKKCAEDKACLVDNDCLGACNYLKKCSDAPSCKNEHGGFTCGYGDVGNGQAPSHFGAASAVVAGHESCCRTLPVAGYVDPNNAGKTVYVDKYEITAGRMRAFIEAVSAMNGGVPKVKDYTAAHRPARWNNGWENALPNANVGTTATFTVTNPTGANLLYPGQDQFLANFPTQNTWSVGSGTFSYDAGIFYMLGAQHSFVEYITGPGWPTPDYAAAHALNCFNGNGSYGYSTYWMDQATVSTYGGGVGKLFTQAQMDEKSLNCTPNAMFAAFCAWDGGQLMTAEVSDAITGNTVEQAYVNASTYQNGKLAVARGQCPQPDPVNYPGSTLISYSDGGTPCYSYFYPFIAGGETYDGSSRIAPPGRVVADQVKIAAADEPWMDMMGNVQDVVIKKGETTRFDYRGFGNEWGSIVHHKNQQTTPRNKGGAFGARCMRFK